MRVRPFFALVMRWIWIPAGILIGTVLTILIIMLQVRVKNGHPCVFVATYGEHTMSIECRSMDQGVRCRYDPHHLGGRLGQHHLDVYCEVLPGRFKEEEEDDE